jgi:hypothetical protein
LVAKGKVIGGRGIVVSPTSSASATINGTRELKETRGVDETI